jgi:diguanylate cyclase (GGDEF)-like protein/PAS domain S-box-containing protein
LKGLLESRDSTELRRIIDQLGMAAFVIDVDDDGSFRLAAINERHEQLTGMRHAESAGRRIDEILPSESASRVCESYLRCARQRAPIDYQESLELPVGTTYWQTTLVPYMNAAGKVFRLLGTALEISPAIYLELQTRYQDTLLSAYLEESPDGILVVDADYHIKTWNRRFVEIWSIPDGVMTAGDGAGALESVRGQLKDPDQFIGRVLDLYDHLDEEERGYRVEMRDGRVFERHSRGLRDPRGTYWGRIWFYRDVTAREQMTAQLEQFAWTDMLTHTANRRAFMEALSAEFSRARRYKHPLTVLMIDLDRFKSVNDQYGHEGGDAALKAFAHAVRPLLRDTDRFARMGGEEFAVLLPETDLDEGRQLAERLRGEIAGMTVISRCGSFGITVSIGVAELRPEDVDAEEPLNRADRALYAAKRGGRNRVSVTPREAGSENMAS